MSGRNKLGGPSLNEDTDYSMMSLAESMHTHLPAEGANAALRQVAAALGLTVPSSISPKDPDAMAFWLVENIRFRLRSPVDDYEPLHTMGGKGWGD